MADLNDNGKKCNEYGVGDRKRGARVQEQIEGPWRTIMDVAPWAGRKGNC